MFELLQVWHQTAAATTMESSSLKAIDEAEVVSAMGAETSVKARALQP